MLYMYDRIQPHSTVVVVGAGASGIAASEKLLTNGFKVVLIEARDRMGGRASTKLVGSVPFDAGASWLTESKMNYLRTTAESSGARLYPTDFNRALVQYKGVNVPVDLTEVMTALEGRLILPYIKSHIREFFGLRKTLPSMASMLDPLLKKHGAQAAYAREIINANEATNLDRTSIATLLRGHDLTGDNGWDPLPMDDVMINGGMQAFVVSLAKKVKPSLGEAVQAVIRTDSGITIQTTRRRLDADALIVTVPLGLLKAGIIQFDPGLPVEHRAAIDRLGFGILKKTCLVYPESNWAKENHLVGLHDSPYFNFIVNVAAISGQPMIMALSAGDKQIAADSLSIDELAIELHSNVRETLGSDVPDPIDHSTTDWGNDPYALGSYSHSSLDTLGNEAEILQRPIAGRILLAGEALSDRNGYVDGAWNDGQRAASVIINNL
jgi:polyamine oxidase